MLDKTDVETIIRDRILSAEHSLEAIEGTLDDLKSAFLFLVRKARESSGCNCSPEKA